MEKMTGQKLKKDLEATKTKLQNLHVKINKKFLLILDEYPQYIPEPHKTFLQENSYLDLNTASRLDVIIVTEAEYVKQTGKQAELFK